MKGVKAMKIYALTTVDNPWNPFTNFREWLTFDITNGYNSSEFLARIAKTSDSLTAEENNEEIRRACLQIMREDPLNIYKMVEGEEADPKVEDVS